jgi:hypothetical protein
MEEREKRLGFADYTAFFLNNHYPKSRLLYLLFEEQTLSKEDNLMSSFMECLDKFGEFRKMKKTEYNRHNEYPRIQKNDCRKLNVNKENCRFPF